MVRLMVLGICIVMASSALAKPAATTGPPPGTPDAPRDMAMGPPSNPSAAGGNIWTDVTPPASPGRSLSPVMAYDSLRGRFLLLGGTGRNETWSYDPVGNAWTNLSVPGPFVLNTTGAVSMVYDGAADRFILFGGGFTTSPSLEPGTETWSFNPAAKTWTDLAPAVHPSQLPRASMAYDAYADRVVLFGGQSVAPQHPYSASWMTWVYDYANNSWSQPFQTPSPAGRWAPSMTFDSQTNRVLLFGGVAGFDFICCHEFNDTWAYDTSAIQWTNLTSSLAPPARNAAGWSFDPAFGSAILFGGDTTDSNGFSQPSFSDTWAFNASTDAWTDENPAISPPARGYSPMGFDPTTDRTVLFGGAGANDTWTYQALGGTLSLPSAPRSLAASSSSTAINLTWDPPSSLGGGVLIDYRVYRGLASGAEDSEVAVGLARNFRDINVTAGTTYWYAVRAETAAGLGPPSNEVSAGLQTGSSGQPSTGSPAPEGSAWFADPLVVGIVAVAVVAIGIAAAALLLRRRRQPPRDGSP